VTRINLVDPQELHPKHLLGEWHEIVRVFSLVRALRERGINRFNYQKRLKVPKAFTMGKGHVTFFYDKMDFIAKRYESLAVEMERRGYAPKRIPMTELLHGVEPFFVQDYQPTPEAITISKQRIAEMMPTNGS